LRRRSLELPRTGIPGLRRSPLHPVADKRVEHLMENGENGFELFADVLLLMCGIESDRGHRRLLTNLAAIFADEVVGMPDGPALPLIGEI
jgi:hypothetical protein